MSSENEDPALITSVNALIEQSHVLHASLNTLISTNSSLRFYANKLLSKMGEFTTHFGKMDNVKCAICFAEEKTHALIPCGHAMCEQCVLRCTRRNSCFVCRSATENSLKIFG